MNREDLVGFLIENGRRWVESQRDLHRSSARALSESERSELAPFFEPKTLNRARVKVVPTIESPEFYSVLPDEANADLLLTFNRMTGITFENTILISKSQMPFRTQLLPLLFHELVHVVQYEVLGLHAFMERYVRGWAENGFIYHAIPLERDAYELQEQYEVNPRLSFSVTEETRRRLGFY
ncbi:MAG: hypothetical protein JSV16_10170 [Candidatus Hydrogenedentota bacterium]|nr:MAG: hypothetical protein JSV16_10170 [Candidatus Hydrogenedentota bacterium]